MKPKIRSSVGVVKLDDNIVEFFKGNTRESFMVKVNAEKILKILKEMNGENTLLDIKNKLNLDEKSIEQIEKLVDILKERSIIVDEEIRNIELREKYGRVFSMLEDYCKTEDEVLSSWMNIRNSRIVIIGLGAVGSWIAANLVQLGVRNFIFIDPDEVEITNIHRQWGYGEGDVGKKKTEVLTNRLLEIEDDLVIKSVNIKIEERVLERVINESVNLIINCADKPTVDQTSEWVGEYCMVKNIPHIIGGGYNLHLSLIGQTVIPNKTACVKCFEIQLKERNQLETSNMKKLARETRKIGSFGPMCSLAASFAATDAFKVLSKIIDPTNINRRGEFNINTMDIKYHYVKKLDECPWCGSNGKYKR
ncbi:ThiF family adenylyltransferase [Clostridium sp. ATCC 25772]|uniref:ThiF family adenylyltransferase n=1 Tax=Clostridium sp. ATCC 25772 TaxID=1676991 RepID=UPI0007844144|nr:ThiF family adenylyltransferase [Clostridium sp. ATCC 25772]